MVVHTISLSRCIHFLFMAISRFMFFFVCYVIEIVDHCWCSVFQSVQVQSGLAFAAIWVKVIASSASV